MFITVGVYSFVLLLVWYSCAFSNNTFARHSEFFKRTIVITLVLLGAFSFVSEENDNERLTLSLQIIMFSVQTVFFISWFLILFFFGVFHDCFLSGLFYFKNKLNYGDKVPIIYQNQIVSERAVAPLDNKTWRNFSNNQRLFYMTLHRIEEVNTTPMVKDFSFSLSDTNYSKIRSISKSKTNAFINLTELFIDNAVFASETWASFYKNEKVIFPKLCKLRIDTCDFMAVDGVYDEFLNILEKLESLKALFLDNCLVPKILANLGEVLRGIVGLVVFEISVKSTFDQVPGNGELIFEAFNLVTHKALKTVSISSLGFDLPAVLKSVVQLFDNFDEDQEKRKFTIDVGYVPYNLDDDVFPFDAYFDIMYFASSGHLKEFYLIFPDKLDMKIEVFVAVCFAKYLIPELKLGFDGDHNGALVHASIWQNIVTVIGLTQLGKDFGDQLQYAAFLVASRDAPQKIRFQLATIFEKLLVANDSGLFIVEDLEYHRFYELVKVKLNNFDFISVEKFVEVVKNVENII